jgi:hypothetical protein
MKFEGPAALVGALKAHRPIAVAGAAVIVVALLAGGLLLAASAGGPAPTEQPTPYSFLATPTAGATPQPTDTPLPTPSPSPTNPPIGAIAATTDGVLIPANYSDVATRHPIAVMIDDQSAARPQSGLSQADIVYQAPAEGGIPRYMAIFQTQLPATIGPIRSSRLYYVQWAEEWRALYVHMLGAPNALGRLAQISGTTIFNADGLHFGANSGYMQRVHSRAAPHNLYSSGAQLVALCQKVGATAPFTKSPWTFGAEMPLAQRLLGGTIMVPYHGNTITYQYDAATNTYPRGVSGQAQEMDLGNGQRIAPSNVIVMWQPVGMLAGHANMKKHRLDIDTIGTGKAMVFTNGVAVQARWTKKTESSPTIITYAGGSHNGQPVPLVRGQIFVQVVPTDMNVTWTLGRTQPPSIW